MPASLVRFLITTGPTQEPIDAVRFIGNRSSGRMGLAIAAEAARRGHPTTMLLGPGTVEPPEHSHLVCHRFRTSRDLEQALHHHWPAHDILVMAAAVADFRPRVIEVDTKLSRDDGPLELTLDPVPDLVAGVAARRRPDQIVVGFALEPADRLEESARAKLEAKQLDAIVANPLETMDADRVTAVLFRRSAPPVAAPPDITKAEFAGWLLDELRDLTDAGT